MRFLRCVFLSVLACAGAFGQAAPPRLEFEVASIKPTADAALGATAQVNIGVHIDGAQIRCNYLSVADYIRIAYKVKNYQVTGPDWIDGARFDIAAKLPAGATRDQVPEMLQSLLADRFGLKLHRDKKEFPVYALVVGKNGVRMKESPVDADEAGVDPSKAPLNVNASGSAAGTTIDFGKGSSLAFGNNRFEGRKITMTSLADTLSGFLEKPVVDMTDLKPSYDFQLEVTPEDYQVMLIRSAVQAGVVLPPQALRLLDGPSGDSLLTALDKMGLKLESRKAPLDLLVIDHVLKTPIEN